MHFVCIRMVLVAAALGWAVPARAQPKLTIERRASEDASVAFRFKTVPAPRKADTGAKATFSLVDGERDPNGGSLAQLHDGRLPNEEDQPRANFFFQAGTRGGRICADLGAAKALNQIRTYSWHASTRGPQVYALYAAAGSTNGFEPAPKRDLDPAKCGWSLLTKVDTRTPGGEPGGQHAVSLTDPAGTLGTWRYLLFDISPTETEDAFGNTFYSEIDIVAADDPDEPSAKESPAEVCEEKIQTGEYLITIDTTETPDLTDWVRREVGPMAREWYPKLVQMLPSEGYAAPTTVRIMFSQDMRGVAATGGTRVRCAASWFRENLKGEALGAIFHELVHVVQQYGRARPSAEGATRPPGWLVEGIADYLRWFKFQPEAHGAEITSRNLARARYDGNYRISANFLNWATETYDRDLIQQLNAAIRTGKYGDGLWKERTGLSVQELGDKWKAAMENKVSREQAAK